MRGLKCEDSLSLAHGLIVAPHVGAWIEISSDRVKCVLGRVAPHVGAWIEMYIFLLISDFEPVAPHVGAWIEIKMMK